MFLILIFSVSAEKTIASEKIKIGLLVPLTGKNSEIGQSIIKSTRLAINKINNLSIEIIPRDTQSDPKSTLKVAKELSQLGVKIIIGPVFNENLIYLDELPEITPPFGAICATRTPLGRMLSTAFDSALYAIIDLISGR